MPAAMPRTAPSPSTSRGTPPTGPSPSRRRTVIRALVRDGIVTVLSLSEGIEVVGEAADGEAAVSAAVATRPDVALIDLRMPVLDGAGTAERLRREAPGVRVVVLTTYADDASIARALRAGATGYLTKDAGREEIIAAVRAAAAGGTPLDARIAGRVVAGLPDEDAADVRTRFPELTGREAEVVELIAAGRTNPEIASTLFLAVSTVKTHVNAIFAKLHVADRRGAVEAFHAR